MLGRLRVSWGVRRGSVGSTKLGELELLVLLASIRLGEDEAYAVSIAEDIESQADRSVQRATVYVVLKRLEEKGMVSTRLGDPVAERGGRARRLVKVEPQGIEAVREVRETLRSMWSGLDPILDGAS